MPENLLERIIKSSTRENDIVLDPFGGTGTTAYVAKKINRKYITMDISEKYYKAIVKRLNEKIIPETEYKTHHEIINSQGMFAFSDSPSSKSSKRKK